MTIQEVFQKTTHFYPSDNWGDINMVHPVLIFALDRFRDLIKHPLYISPVEGAVYAEGKGHSDKSYHYVIKDRNTMAMAADVFPDGDLIDIFIEAIKVKDFGGVGLYPFNSWQRSNKKFQGMLHLDIRSYTKKALWWRNAGKIYKDLNTAEDINNLINSLKNIGIIK